MNLLAASYGDISSEDENAEDGKVAKPYYWKTVICYILVYITYFFYFSTSYYYLQHIYL